ncbi:Plasmodium exported protein (Pm-fam-a like), unknown function, partial [Plasmodium malariae]
CTYNKSNDRNYKHCKKFYTKSYRTLAKCKQNNNLNNVCLEEMFENNGENHQRDISNNEKCRKGKNESSNRRLLNKAQYYTEIIDYNNGTFDGKNFHFEKKWIKKKDYDCYLEKRRRICNIALKKIKLRSYGFGVFLFFLFFLLGIGIPALYGINSLNIKWSDIEKHPFWKYFKDPIKSIVPKEIRPYIHIISFSILIIIISVILIVVIYKILRNNEKYNKIKLIYG